MHIVLMGLNHDTAPLAVRERLAFRRDQLPDVFQRLREETGLQEALVLSTCNRVEIYGGVPQLDGTAGRLRRFLDAHGGSGLEGLADRLYFHQEPQSIRHLFSVASGLESMVLGESEILHQVKHAYEWARDCGATGKVFNALCQRALNTAKAVRSGTDIARGRTSVGSVAIELAEKIFGRLTGAVVVLVGAGDIGELTVQCLAARGVRDLRIVNRSLARACEVAARHGASAVPFGRLLEHLAAADIVITSTASTSYVLSREEVAEVMRRRAGRPLCVLDLGVPRNVEPSAGRLEHVYRFDVDDLGAVVAQTQQGRAQAVLHSRRIIDEKVDRFLAWWGEEGVCAASASVPAAAR